MVDGFVQGVVRPSERQITIIYKSDGVIEEITRSPYQVEHMNTVTSFGGLNVILIFARSGDVFAFELNSFSFADVLRFGGAEGRINGQFEPIDGVQFQE